MRNEYFVYIRPLSSESFDSSEYFPSESTRTSTTFFVPWTIKKSDGPGFTRSHPCKLTQQVVMAANPEVPHEGVWTLPPRRQLPVALARRVVPHPDAPLGADRAAARHPCDHLCCISPDLYRAPPQQPGVPPPTLLDNTHGTHPAPCP